MNHMIVHRYFVIKITEGGKSVFLGLGFEDRADSFDLQTTLHDYFKGLLVNVFYIFEKVINKIFKGRRTN